MESIDIYINYRCNLKCKHCFLVESLNAREHMSRNQVLKIVNYGLQNQKIKEVVILGGEPTLHKELSDIIKDTFSIGIENIRLVTNGGSSCIKFLTNFDGVKKPNIVFSIDGATRATHDSIRGEGSYEKLLKSIHISQKLGYKYSAIVSFCKINSSEADKILPFLESMGVSSVTIHYVSPRDSSIEDIQLSPNEWLDIKRIIKTQKHDISVRFDTVFREKKQNCTPTSCSIRTGSNLMFMPNGEVYTCGLFIDSPYSGSFRFNNNSLKRNHINSEFSVANSTANSCPGMNYLLSNTRYRDYENFFQLMCIYDKDEI